MPGRRPPARLAVLSRSFPRLARAYARLYRRAYLAPADREAVAARVGRVLARHGFVRPARVAGGTRGTGRYAWGYPCQLALGCFPELTG